MVGWSMVLRDLSSPGQVQILSRAKKLISVASGRAQPLATESVPLAGLAAEPAMVTTKAAAMQTTDASIILVCNAIEPKRFDDW